MTLRLRVVAVDCTHPEGLGPPVVLADPEGDEFCVLRGRPSPAAG